MPDLIAPVQMCETQTTTMLACSMGAPAFDFASLAIQRQRAICSQEG